MRVPWDVGVSDPRLHAASAKDVNTTNVAVILAQDPAVNHDAQKHTRSSWKVFSSAFCQIQIQGRPNLIGEYVT